MRLTWAVWTGWAVAIVTVADTTTTTTTTTSANTRTTKRRRLYGSSLTPGSWRDRVLSSASSKLTSIETDAHGKGISEHNSRHLQSSLAMQTCLASILQEEEVGAEFGAQCSCEQSGADQVVLKCQDTSCAYCNAPGSTCTGYGYGVVFDATGRDIEFFEEDTYMFGRMAGSTIKYLEADGSCSLSVDDETCQSCQVQDCQDEEGYYGIVASCGNLESGATFNSCQDNFSTSGILEAYSMSEFGTCITDLCPLIMKEPHTPLMQERFECSCNNDNPTENVVTCTDACEYCQESANGNLVCGQETYQEVFENADWMVRQWTIQYTAGRSETVEYEEFECDEATGECAQCAVRVNDIACDSCSLIECADGSKRAQVQCANIDSSNSETLEMCNSSSLQGSVLEFFQDGFAQESTCTSKAELGCRQAKSKYELHAHQYQCECVEQEQDGVQLKCEATCGGLCDDEESVCVRESFEQDFVSNTGKSAYFRKDIQYTLGRKENLSYIEYEDGICKLQVDGKECQSCVMQTCSGNPQVEKAPLLDCSNLEPNAMLDLCKTGLQVETGVFQRFSMSEFQQCLDRKPANGVCPTNLRITELPYAATGTTLMIPSDSDSGCGSVETFSSGLWYTVVGSNSGIVASVCDERTDFGAHISVYSGADCDNRECFADSNNSCQMEWVAEDGVMYYIRVGGIGAEIGNFHLSLEETNHGTVMCKEYKEELEGRAGLDTTCQACEEPDENGEIHLHCTVTCATCDETGSICTNQTLSTTFDKMGYTIQNQNNYRFVTGRQESVEIQRLECSSPDDCDICEISIDGEQCGSCEIVDCPQEYSIGQGVIATCGDVTIDTCSLDELDKDNVLYPLKPGSSFEYCYEKNAMIACSEYMDNEQSLEEQIVCDCEEVGVDSEGARMVCRRESCLKCNEEGNICGYDAFGAMFDPDTGRLVDRFDGFQYVEGRFDLIAYHILNDVHTQADGTCQMTINDGVCAGCRVTSCDGENDGDAVGRGLFHGVDFDCENIETGIFFDGCSDASLPGRFAFLNSPAFDKCVDVTDPLDTCEQMMMRTMTARSGRRDYCSCDLLETGFFEMTCTDEEVCYYCNEDGNVCADYLEHTVEINRFGTTLARVETFQFTEGRNELLVLRDNDLECQVTIDGLACASCEYVDCGDGRDFAIDCSNILGDGAAYSCGEGHDIFVPINNDARYTCPSKQQIHFRTSQGADNEDGSSHSPKFPAPAQESSAIGFSMAIEIAALAALGLFLLF